MRGTLIVMLKEPRPGRVKTRLGTGIGRIRAAWWFRHQSTRLLREVTDPRWQTVLAVSPDREGRMSRVWPAHLPRIAQGRGDLGARMARLFAALPGGPALIVGADIPGITRAHIARAFAVLGARDMGPGDAGDVGADRRRRHPRHHPGPYRARLRRPRGARRGARPGFGRRLLADRVETQPPRPHMFSQGRALVFPPRALRYAGQPRPAHTFPDRQA